MENLKYVHKSNVSLQMLNVASFLLVGYTVIFCNQHLKDLPDMLQVSHMAGIGRSELVSKNIFWNDLFLMVTSYLLISVISIYLRVIPFRNNKGQAMAIMASFTNLCISLIFSLVIVGTLQQVLR